MLPQRLFQSLALAVPEALSSTGFARYLRQSLQFDFASAQSRDRIRQSRLQHIKESAARTELYRDLMQAQSFIITKADFRRHYPTGVLARSPEKDWQYLSTSGTTDRLSVVADFIKRDHRRSSELRALCIAIGTALGHSTVEIPPNVCNVVCGIDDGPPPKLRHLLWKSLKNGSIHPKTASDLRGIIEKQMLLRKVTLPPIDPAPGPLLAQQLDHCLARIAEQRPVLLRGYPQYLMWLADRARLKEQQVPSLKFVLPYGGLASLQMISRIETGLSAKFRNVYGTSELGMVAASCGRSAGMHLFEDLFQVDLASSDAQQAGPLLITDLVNDAMPIVRYQVGDTGRLHTSSCPCNRKTARLEVLGRVQETLHLNGKAIYPSEVADTFYADQNIANARLEEVAPGCFEASIAATPDASPPDTQSWQDRFRALAGSGIKRLKCRVVAELRPETSGKYLLVWPYRDGA
jgi:phenylacetate-coenzyme A ligase PaaK-like adenylate-forming protein